MTKTNWYHVELEPEEGGGYSVHVPALPGCHTQGDTMDEALANAREAIELHIEGLKEIGHPVPAPDGDLHHIVRVA
jgi:predicted RNase H-like HicB family nuclease